MNSLLAVFLGVIAGGQVVASVQTVRKNRLKALVHLSFAALAVTIILTQASSLDDPRGLVPWIALGAAGKLFAQALERSARRRV